MFSLFLEGGEIGLDVRFVGAVKTTIYIKASQDLKYITDLFITVYCRYLTEMFGRDGGRMKLSQIMGCLVELRQLCERSKSEETPY